MCMSCEFDSGSNGDDTPLPIKGETMNPSEEYKVRVLLEFLNAHYSKKDMKDGLKSIVWHSKLITYMSQKRTQYNITNITELSDADAKAYREELKVIFAEEGLDPDEILTDQGIRP